MRWLNKNCLFPLKHFRIIDPDFFRDLLPENRRLIEINPDTSGYLTQKEAGYLAGLYFFIHRIRFFFFCDVSSFNGLYIYFYFLIFL